MAFIGIKVPVETGRLLKGIEVPGKREDASEYHITLMFFAKNWEVSKVSKALEAAYEVTKETKPFTVKVKKVSSFPKTENNPIPIIAKVESEELHKFRDELAKKFDDENVEFSKIFKDFKPHITLAYLEADKGISEFEIDSVEFTVSEIVLWAGDHGDDRLFITFPLKGPEKEKKSSFLLQKSDMFLKIANNPYQQYLTSTSERRNKDR